MTDDYDDGLELIAGVLYCEECGYEEHEPPVSCPASDE